MRFESSSAMTVSGDEISPPDTQLQTHPHLAALIKWWVSCVWGVAGLVLRRLLRVPPTLPALPALGRVKNLLAPGAPTSSTEPEQTVTCSVLCDPPDANVDVIFVHGLYGSLVNTWKQGQWRSKHKTGPKRIPLKRHVSLPENNYVNDQNNNANIQEKPSIKKKNKSEEYCSCDNRYYTINVKKQCDINNNINKDNININNDNNNNSKTILKNDSNINKICNNIEEFPLKSVLIKELTNRRKSVPNPLRTEVIETTHIERIISEIMKNSRVLDLKLNETLNKDVTLEDFFEKFLNMYSNNDEIIRNIYEHYDLLKEMQYKKQIERKSVSSYDLINLEEYKSLGDDLDQICDRIEYFISKFNSQFLISEVGLKKVCDIKFECDNKIICDMPNEINNESVFNNQVDDGNILNKNKLIFGNNVAIKIDKSALNIDNATSKSAVFDCDKNVCDSFKEFNGKNVINFDHLQNILTNKIKRISNIDGVKHENEINATDRTIDNDATNSEISNTKFNKEDSENSANKIDEEFFKNVETSQFEKIFKNDAFFEVEREENIEIASENTNSAEFSQDIDQICEKNAIFHFEELQSKKKYIDLTHAFASTESVSQNYSNLGRDNEKFSHQNPNFNEVSDSQEPKDIHFKGLNNENEGSEVSYDRSDGKVCEVGCGCVCSKCYSSCWPRDWLQVDCPQARVIAVNYTSDPYLWRPIWIKEQKRTGLQQRADEMVHQLLELGVGRKPIVWVGHSKGGLFIKRIYTDAYESYCTSQKNTKEASGESTNSKIEQFEPIWNTNHKTRETKYCDDDVVEELRNDNFSVRLETEFSDEGFAKKDKFDTELNLEENIAKMVSDTEDDLKFHYEKTMNFQNDDQKISESNNESVLRENCEVLEKTIRDFDENQISLSEYMFLSKNVADKGRVYDENGSGIIVDRNPEIDKKNQSLIDENSNDYVTNQKNEEVFKENQSFESQIEENSTNTQNEKRSIFDSTSRELSDSAARNNIETCDKSALWSSTRGFMFYSVPHRGSPLAGIRSPLFARSVELLEISENCASVLALQGAWLGAVRAGVAVVRSFVETARTLMAVLWLRIVSVESADAGVGELCGVGLDHREICKPSSRTCFLYRELLAVIRRESTNDHAHSS